MIVRTIAGLVVVAGIFLVVLSAFVVSETEQVVVTQFGEPIGDPISDAGLHFRVPFIQDVRRFEKRILQWDGEVNQIPTSEKKYIEIDTMARWRVANPLEFLKATAGSERQAQSLLDDVIDGAVRDVISTNPLLEMVRSSNREMVVDTVDEAQRAEPSASLKIEGGRESLSQKITVKAAAGSKDLGIELLDVRIKRMNYIDRVLKEVYNRMVSERHRIAERFRSEGKGEASKILGRLDRELKEIESVAYRKAEEIRGQADAEAAQIYADAYQRDPEFYRFMKTLETYESSLRGGEVTLLMSSAGDLFSLLTNPVQ